MGQAAMSFSSSDLAQTLSKHPKVPGVSIALIENGKISTMVAGSARDQTRERMSCDHYLQCASLSKTVAAAFAIEYFARRGVSMDTSANSLLRSCGSAWTIKSNSPLYNADAVTLAMLVNHTALGMHYVYGIPLTERSPNSEELLDGRALRYKYHPLFLERSPGQSFSYSGGGFVVLQHLIETMEAGRSIDVITRSFLDACGLHDFVFTQSTAPRHLRFAFGHLDRNQEVPSLAFPPFAAGGLCPPKALAQFLQHLYTAYHYPAGSGPISNRTARLMLAETNLVDRGAMDFMGAKIGLGVFVAQAGSNKIMLHQAANDGYRGVYMLCFDGPDAGKGFVILSNGDNPAVLLQGELCRRLLKSLDIRGIDYGKYRDQDLKLNIDGVKQESIVNKGLKDLVVSAFQPTPCMRSRL